ncbi:MAG: hypothetical protein J5855_03225, partial [Mailhella sp.]|nr:hypothetical protein [Mailhella sp.]
QSRSSVEMADKNARPAIKGALPDLGKYDVVFLGYPIWWAVAPRIMSTFVEGCSLQGKTVVPFCTSGGSAFAKSADMLIAASAGAKWLPGKRLMAGAHGADIEAWLKELGLK